MDGREEMSIAQNSQLERPLDDDRITLKVDDGVEDENCV